MAINILGPVNQNVSSFVFCVEALVLIWGWLPREIVPTFLKPFFSTKVWSGYFIGVILILGGIGFCYAGRWVWGVSDCVLGVIVMVGLLLEFLKTKNR